MSLGEDGGHRARGGSIMGIKQKFLALTGIVGLMLALVSALGYYMAQSALNTSIQG